MVTYPLQYQIPITEMGLKEEKIIRLIKNNYVLLPALTVLLGCTLKSKEKGENCSVFSSIAKIQVFSKEKFRK